MWEFLGLSVNVVALFQHCCINIVDVMTTRSKQGSVVKQAKENNTKIIDLLQHMQCQALDSVTVNSPVEGVTGQGFET